MSAPSRSLAVALVALAPGCVLDTTASGTAVGNPTDMAAHVAPGEGLTWEQATARVSTASFTACGGAADVQTVDADVDLLGGTSLPVPAGEWCSFTLAFASPLTLTGRTTQGEQGALALVVDAVEVGALTGVASDDGPFVLELAAPGWVVPSDLVGGGVDAERMAELVAAVRRGSALFRDDDADGEVGDDEREAGHEAEGEDWDHDDDSG